VVVSLSAVDAHSGVAKIYYSVNGSDYQEGTSVTIEEEGTNEVAYYSVDHAGNKEAVQTAFVKVDRTAPSTVSTITDAWFNHDVTVSLTSEDALSGVEKTFFSVNGSDYQEGTSFTVNQEGINEVMYYSVDAAGNQEAVHTEYVKVDKTAPVSESDISEEWSSVDVEVTLSASDSHSGVERTYYSINGSQLQQGTRFTVSQEGINEVIFYTIDVAGNKEEVQAAYVKIDKSAPTIEMDVNELYELGSQVQLTYTATDELSGVAFEEMVITAPKEASGKVVENGAAVSLNKPGVYTVTVTAVDVVGNRTTITRQFNVYIPATIEITPKVIKGNKGVFTVRVDVPSEFEGKLDLDTATLNGVRALNSNKGYYNQAKLGQFKFERSDFSWTDPEVLVEFVGYVDGYLVKGHTTAIVKK
jgi:hypothetical protein